MISKLIQTMIGNTTKATWELHLCLCRICTNMLSDGTALNTDMIL